MPIQPTPTTYTCSVCGWSKTVAPHSDALMSGDVFEVCPRCGHEPLDNRELSALKGLLIRIKEMFKK